MNTCFRWTRPIFGERLRQFDNRKTCMICRKPIVLVRRYGRIINKTAIDLMERVFYQRFSQNHARLDSEITQVAQEVKNIETGDSGTLQSPSTVRSLDRIRKKVVVGARDYQKLVATSQRYFIFDCSHCLFLCCSTPSIDIYRKIRSSILGKAKEQNLSQEETEAELSRLTVPKPDPSRACK